MSTNVLQSIPANPHAAASFLTPQVCKYGGAALIAVLAAIAYWPVHDGGFVFDDELLIVYNPMIKASDGLYRYWFTKEALDYWPVTNTSFWLEWRLWGTNTVGYHLSNLILHVVDALLIWLVLKRLSVPWPWLAALLFAVHPINVESVAWISQRKNLLALLFFLISILWWLRVQAQTDAAATDKAKNRWPSALYSTIFNRWYALSLLAFLLAMLSKGSVAILPLILLLIVWWQRDRITWSDIVASVPFFVVSLILTKVDIWFQAHDSGIIREVSFLQRLLGAGAVIWFYLGKALVPVDLAFIYPQWQIDPNNFLWWLPLLASIVVTLLLFWKRNSQRARWVRPLFVAWLYFCICLFPVMGFADVGYMRHSLVSDHYVHIALISVVAIVASTCCQTYKMLPSHAVRQIVPIGASLVVLIFAWLTWQQSGLYANALTLYTDTIKKNPTSWLVQTNYGLELSRAGKPLEAIPYFQEAFRLNPICAVAQFHWGNALVDLGRVPESLEHYREALKIVPDYALAHHRFGVALQYLGQTDEAEQEYRAALETDPDNPQIHNSLGVLLGKRQQYLQAIEQFQQAVNTMPEYLLARVNLASVYAAAGRYQEAIDYGTDALKLAQSQGDTKAVEGLNARLKFYRDRLAGVPENAPASNEGSKPAEGAKP
jgi:tetratricopeptide (TPR) repeat protein